MKTSTPKTSTPLTPAPPTPAAEGATTVRAPAPSGSGSARGTRTCASCGVTQHAECYAEHGCTTLGCFEFGHLEPSPAPPPARSSRRRRALLGGAALAGAGLLGAFGLPAYLEARQRAAESAAIGALQAISDAQSQFREGDAEGDGVLDYGTLCELARAGLLEEGLAGGVLEGYELVVQPGPSPEFTWWAMARPLEPGQEGQRSFFINYTGVIYFTTEEACPCGVDSFGGPGPGWMCVG